MNEIKFYPFSEKTSMFAPQPAPAAKFIPEWYKKQPAFIGDETKDFVSKGGSSGTIKRCMPIFDLMSAGYIITFPMDVYINATNPEKIEWSVPLELKSFGNDMVATHTKEQIQEYPVDTDRFHKQVFRIMPFWSVQTSKGYSTLFTHPFHRDNVPFEMFSALVDTDQFISDGHLSMYIEKDFNGVIKQGTPLIQVIPFKREEWSSKILTHEESHNEIEKQRLKIRSSFKHSYKEKFRQKKEYK
jgi:hypothetical protein